MIKASNYYHFSQRQLSGMIGCMNTLDLLSDAAADTRGLRNALGRFATGVTVVTTRTQDGKLEGVTANSFSAVSLDPPLVLWSIRCTAPSLPAFLASNCFAINVLSKEQARMSRHFATPQLNKFEGMDFKPGVDGCPIFERSLAIFECRTQTSVQGGDHIILIGRVVRAHYCDGAPLIFASGQYGTHALLTEAE